MTCLERLKQDNPNWGVEEIESYMITYCPHVRGYMGEPDYCEGDNDVLCKKCWEREIPEERKLVFNHTGEPLVKVKNIVEENGGITAHIEPIIKDSGDRTQFESGAVRDMREGKGRCDLMPLRVVGALMQNQIFNELAMFQESGDVNCLYRCLRGFSACWDDGLTKSSPSEILEQRFCTMFLEVSKHYEEGAKKYGENNWQKGIPTWCYIDSAIRHYLKWLRGDKDEPHDRAFVWNLMCCVWEVDYREKDNKEE